METIYYGYMPLVYNRRLFKGLLEVVLKATQDVRNNIPYDPLLVAAIRVITYLY